MKRFIFVAASLACGIAFLSSCAKEETAAGRPDGDGAFAVGVGVSLGQTRADIPATDAEKALVASKTTILVYSSDGALVQSADPGLTASFTLTSGRYKFVALGNWTADPSSLASFSDFGSAVQALDDEVASGRFVMAGVAERTVSADANVTVTVRRLAAKFVVGNVKRTMTGSNASKDFTVKSVFVINAAGNTQYGVLKDFGGSFAPTLWRNERRHVASGSDGYLYKDVVDAPVANGASVSFADVAALYSYANPTASDGHNQAAGVAEKTRVVLECDFGGKTTYYPATVSGVEANKCYTINFSGIKGAGVDNPDDPWPDTYDLGVTIEVGDWYDGGSIEGPTN